MVSNEKYRELITAMVNQMDDNQKLRFVFMTIHCLLIDEEEKGRTI